MEGKIPDPPEGWDDSGPDGDKKNQGDSVGDPSAGDGDSPTIGGTAEQH